MNVVAGSPELFGGRFSAVRTLGQGGFGVVYEAIDTRHGERVAIKVLRPERAAAATRFKREFRSLVDVQHGNLVRLFELAAHDETLFFSMELVDGVDFLAHVSDVPAGATITAEWSPTVAVSVPRVVSIDRLRPALGQLVEAVQALHDARKLHCDVKPSNVLVTHDGRVVLLDFGLVANVDEAARSTLGTPGYMAPEQARGAALSEATDWYSVGAILHEALAGGLPGVTALPEDAQMQTLVQLCTELLAEDPLRRPRGPEILARLGLAPRTSRAELRLVGRDAELATLRAHWQTVRDGSTQIVRVVGESGIGKTALVDQLVVEARSAGAWILASRSYESESVPYKALDGAVDALAELLADQQVPRQPAVLARVFPVLASVVDTEDAAELDSQAARRAAFNALRALLVAVSRDRPLLVFLDDVQWGDVDSARLLAELVRPPDAPRMLVVVTSRPYEARHGFLSTLDEQPLGVADTTLQLTELSASATRELAEQLVGDDRDTVARIGREAAGNPLFIQQLATAPSDDSLGLRDIIIARIADLEVKAQRLVQMLSLAAGPLDERVALAASGIAGADVPAALRAVRQARLVSGRGTSTLLEPAHDRVRETISSTLGPDVARAAHVSLADALLATEDPDPDALVHHLRRADDRKRLPTFALLAAERAETTLAFERAAGHLELLLDVGDYQGEARSLLAERHGDALANAGRGGDAAEAFERAADLATDSERQLVLRRRSCELTLRSGRIELGRERMARVLRDVGVRPPRNRRSAMLVSVGRRLRVFARGVAPKHVSTTPATGAAKARLEALWSASTGLSMVDHVVADALGLQHMLEASATGDRSHLVRGLGYEAAFEAVIGGKYLRTRCGRILDAMDALAAQSGEPYDRAWAMMSRGVTAWFLGDWQTSWSSCDAAAALYREHCRGVAWELAICDAYRLPALAYLGDLAELSRVVPRAYAGARERADLYAVNLLRLGQQSMPFLVEDRPDAAIEEAHAAIAPFPTTTYLLPHYHHLFAVAQAELYRGNPAPALAAIDAAWAGLKQSRLLMVQCLRCEIRHLRARMAIALSRSQTLSERERHRLRALAAAEAKTIARDDVSVASPFAAAIRAGLTDDPAARERELTTALAGFETANMTLYAHACRDRLAASRGTTEPTTTAWFADQQIRSPERMIHMLLPGV